MGSKEPVWLEYPRFRPELGQTCLVYEQGYDITGTRHFGSYELGTFIKHPSDKRRKVFAHHLQVKLEEQFPWVYNRVTHWMPLPPAPPKISKPRAVIALEEKTMD